jgi:biopolymer transport protein ExbD
MKVPRRLTGSRVGINMTPMIDVVFLLVIFFLVSSHLVRQETQIELALPVASSGEDDPMSNQPRVTVNVRADGTLLLSGRPVSPAVLTSRLAALRAGEGDQLEVRVRTGRSQPYASVEPVMMACTQAGVWNVTWSVYRQEPAQ